MSGKTMAAPPARWGLQFLFIGVLGTALLEMASELRRNPMSARMLRLPLFRKTLGPVLERYLGVRSWVVDHPWAAGFSVLAAVGLILLLVRSGLLFWNNQVIARLNGSRFAEKNVGFPVRQFDILAEIGRRPPGHTFVGMRPQKRFWGWSWRPVYLSPLQRTMHRHIIGKTGSGKTTGVLWPSVLQDVLDGKGVIVMDAKGSNESLQMMKSIAAVTGRPEALRVFSLPAWNQPQLFSHAYNLLYVRPRTKTDSGGDPVAVAERVFSVLSLGDNAYYNTQAEVFFVNLCRLLHGMVDKAGNGIPFNTRDVSACLKGIGNTGIWTRALERVQEESTDIEAAFEIRSQLARLGNEAAKCFSGLVAALDKFLSPLVNAYAPDIILEDILQTNGIVYVQLPANLFKLQAPSLGRAILMDVQQAGSLRQIFRTRNQKPFSVVVDEFYNFADVSIIDSLNKLRDAHVEFTLAHQSLADLEIVSREFATAVWDNTRTKDVLSQDNPEFCERISRSIGTQQEEERTVRIQQGALFTSLATGDASSKRVESYKLHPNAIKNLAARGQGYLVGGKQLVPVAYSPLPDFDIDFPLTRNNQQKAVGLRLYENSLLRQD